MSSQEASVKALLERRAAGQILTPDERATLRAYYRRYNTRRVHVHAREDLLDKWRHRAGERGVSLSQWIVDQLEQAAGGHESELASLRGELEEARDAADEAKRQLAETMLEKSNVEGQLRAIEESLVVRLASKMGGRP